MNIFEQTASLESELINLRRRIHESPELSGFEFNTLSLIKETLAQIGIPFYEEPFGGILGIIENGESEKTALLRADIDALPLRESEKNLFCEKMSVSKIDGAAHVCGHDAHTAMLLTAAKVLFKNKAAINGKIILCFERAEEGGGPGGKYGAKPLLAYLEKQNTRIDSCFAIHVNPDIEAGKLSINPGPVLAGGVGFEVRLSGQGGHGSRPDIANHPLECFIAIYHAVGDFRMKQVSPYTPFTFSIPVISSGTRGNAIEKDFVFSGTARFFNPEVGERFIAEFRAILEHTSKLYHCAYKIESIDSGNPTINDEACCAAAVRAVKSVLGPEQLCSAEPLMGSESFRIYIDRYSGAMAFLGIKNKQIGSGADLHDTRFDIDESALKYGAAAYAGYALEEIGMKNNE